MTLKLRYTGARNAVNSMPLRPKCKALREGKRRELEGREFLKKEEN